MGPVLAFTFGTNVRDWGLAKKGFLVEVGVSKKVSAAICFFLLGGITSIYINKCVTDQPTHEKKG